MINMIMIMIMIMIIIIIITLVLGMFLPSILLSNNKENPVSNVTVVTLCG